MKKLRTSFYLLLAGLLFLSVSTQAQLTPRPDFSKALQAWNTLPFFSEGRARPFSQVAGEQVAFLTGQEVFGGWSALELLLSWIAHPEEWAHIEFLSPSSPGGARLSPWAALSSKDAPGLFEKASRFQALASGQAWTLVPAPEGEAWKALTDLSPTDPLIQAFVQGVQAYQNNQLSPFQSAVQTFQKLQWERFQAVQPHRSPMGFKMRLSAEQALWLFHPFAAATLCYALAVLFFRWHRLGRGLAWLGGACHLTGIALRCFIAERPPVTNMYESLLWVSAGIFLGGLFFKRPLFQTVSWVLSALLLGLSELSVNLLDPSLKPLVPVLRSSFWLILHVLTITLSYAAFALAFGLAHLGLWKTRKQKFTPLLAEIQHWTYRTLQAGVTLLAAGTFLGALWADASWGRFWGWDPKEVWALITLLCYLILLHGKLAGWLSGFGFLWGTCWSFLAVLMAWYGVNFILGTGLHSYGFSQGGQGGVALFAGLQSLYLLGVLAWYRRRTVAQPS